MNSSYSLGIIRSEDSNKTKYFRTRVDSDFDVIVVKPVSKDVTFHLYIKLFVSSKLYMHG